MGLFRSQYRDIIEFENPEGKLLVYKYQRPSGDNELKQGSQLIVREGQAAVFVKGGELADIMYHGTYSLETGNFPVLTSLKAFPYRFRSPVIAELYFVSTTQFLNLKWATKTPVIRRDSELQVARIRAFGKFAFRVVDVGVFMLEFFGSRKMVLTYDILQYLASMVSAAFAEVAAESSIPVLDMPSQLSELTAEILDRVNKNAVMLGISFTDVMIEGLSLPEGVEQQLDGRTGAVLGGPERRVYDRLRSLKKLVDEGVLTQAEFEAEKKKLLGN